MGIIYLLAILIIAYGFVAVFLKYTGVKGPNGQPVKLPIGGLAIVIGVLIFLGTSMITKIGPQEVGVITGPQGVKPDPVYSGWRFLMPWEEVHKMDQTTWVYTMTQAVEEGKKKKADEIWCPTKDGIQMGFDISVAWKIDPPSAPWIYQNVSEQDGSDNAKYTWMEENIIRTQSRSVLAQTVSEYTPVECYSDKRQNLESEVYTKLKEKLAMWHLTLENVSLRGVHYPPKFQAAVEEKKLAEQQVMTLEQVTRQKEEQLKQSDIEKNMKIKQAEGEAQALLITGNAINQNPKIIQIEYIKMLNNKWKGDVPKMVSSGNSQNNWLMQIPDL